MLPVLRLIQPALLTRRTSHPAVCRAWLSTSNPRHPQGTRAERERISKLLIAIRDFLRHPQGLNRTDLGSFVHYRLRHFLSQKTTIPHVAYEQVISLLIDSRRLAEASSVYHRMLDGGYVPPSSIDVKMIAVALALAPDDLDDACTVLDETFANPMYTQDDFLKFLRTCLNLGISHAKLVSLMTRFLDARQEGFSPSRQFITKLVDTQTRAGNFRQALEVLSVCNEEGILDPDNTSIIDPYTAIMAAIRHDKSREHLVGRVLSVMQEQGIAPNSKVFDVLIQRNVKTRSFDTAISLFNSLLEMSEKGEIHPTESTFSIIFTLLARLHVQKVSQRTKDGTVDFAASLDPRNLYRTMLRHALSTSHPLSLNSSLLSDALYMFIASRDYPAAFLVVRAFDLFDLDVEVRTYRILLFHVWARFLEDSKRNATSHWVAKFLGGASLCAQSREQLMSRVLMWMEQKEFNVNRGPYDIKIEHHAKPSSSYDVPSLGILNREEPLPLGEFLDMLPLARLLRRAILADIQTTSGFKESVPGALVSKAISEAKSALLPQDQKIRS